MNAKTLATEFGINVAQSHATIAFLRAAGLIQPYVGERTGSKGKTPHVYHRTEDFDKKWKAFVATMTNLITAAPKDAVRVDDK